MNRKSRVPRQDVQVQSLIDEITSRSGGRSDARPTVHACVRPTPARPSGSDGALDHGVAADAESKRPAVAGPRHIGSLRRRQACHLRPSAGMPQAQTRSCPGPAWVTCSRQSTRPCRHRSTCAGASQPNPTNTSIAPTNCCAASAASADRATRARRFCCPIAQAHWSINRSATSDTITSCFGFTCSGHERRTKADFPGSSQSDPDVMLTPPGHGVRPDHARWKAGDSSCSRSRTAFVAGWASRFRRRHLEAGRR
jgi:hypothetical protein